MLELATINQEFLNTKTRITIDYIKNGKDFLEQFDINHDLLRDTVSVIYRFLRVSGKIPHNLYKFYIAAYYIVSRNPQAFPQHEAKKEFCRSFNISPSSLDYSVERIINTLDLIKILDDRNFPYFLDPKSDLAYNISKNVVKSKVEKVRMNFLLYNQSLSSHYISEDLVSKLVLEMGIFPEELLSQIYGLIYELVERELNQHNEYIRLQQRYFI